MKRILIFIGLKFAELVVAPGILLTAGYYFMQWLDRFRFFAFLSNRSSIYYESFLGGLSILFFFGIGYIFYTIIYWLIATNWHKAGELEKKWTRKL